MPAGVVIVVVDLGLHVALVVVVACDDVKREMRKGGRGVDLFERCIEPRGCVDLHSVGVKIVAQEEYALGLELLGHFGHAGRRCNLGSRGGLGVIGTSPIADGDEREGCDGCSGRGGEEKEELERSNKNMIFLSLI